MKILHVASEYPPAKVYGLGRFVHGLARAQAAAGDEIHVLTNSNGGEQDDVKIDGVHLHRIAFPNPPRPPEGNGEVLQFNHGVISRALDRRAALAGVEVVASHDWLTALGAREIARALGAPLVPTFHDEVIGKRFGRHPANEAHVRELEALAAHDGMRVIANSAFIADQVARHYGAADRLAVVLGGIDPAVTHVKHEGQIAAFRLALASPEETLLVFVGRLEAEKGVDVLARAALEVARSRPELRLAIAGTGTLEGELRYLFAPLGNRVTFVGYAKGELLAYLYRAADVVAVPSLYEPFGLVALEAMAAGRALIASRVGGLAEIVRDGEDGVLTAPGDESALAEAVRSLSAQPDLRRRLGAAACARVEREFSWSAVAARTRTVYEEARGARRSIAAAVPARPAGPLVSVVVETNNDPVAIESCRRSVLNRTHGVRIDVTTIEHGSSEARARAIEAARGDYVCFLSDQIEVPHGSEDWLEALVWTIESMGAERVAPGLVGRDGRALTEGLFAPRRMTVDDAKCVLVRRAGGQGSWLHPVHVCLHQPEALRVSIVLVAWSGLRLTLDALESILKNTRRPFELVLVDNGSTDGTREELRAVRDRLGCDVPCQLLENDENRGYPVAANQGIRAARGRDVVLLNNDATVRAGWLEALLEAKESDPRVGVVTAKVLSLDGTVQSAGGIIHQPDESFTIEHEGEDRLAPTVQTRRVVTNAGGPCLLLTRELIQEIGVFDEVFSPAYFEDSDLCFRARAAGFRLLYEPAAEVVHHGKATANAVARDGKIDIWTRFDANKRLFHERWAVQLEEDDRARSLAREAGVSPRRRVVLCYGKDAFTTAAYCEAALRERHDVVTAGPGQEIDQGPTATAEQVLEVARGADLLVAIEGVNYSPRDLEDAPCPTAWWAIDNHIHARLEESDYFEQARQFDHVFVAQRDYQGIFRQQGLSTHWLPLACDPRAHGPRATERDLGIVFVGNVLPIHRRRAALLKRLARRFGARFVQRRGVWGEDMAALHSRAQIVFNCSLAGDLNMRVFEGLASGALVLTDRIGNGLGELFADREHLVLYDDEALEELAEQLLDDDETRESVARRGQALATRHHTYAHRMNELVRVATRSTGPTRMRVRR